jgi:hypothetical protein
MIENKRLSEEQIAALEAEREEQERRLAEAEAQAEEAGDDAA